MCHKSIISFFLILSIKRFLLTLHRQNLTFAPTSLTLLQPQDSGLFLHLVDQTEHNDIKMSTEILKEIFSSYLGYDKHFKVASDPHK